jgi:hypothetical protein
MMHPMMVNLHMAVLHIGAAAAKVLLVLMVILKQIFLMLLHERVEPMGLEAVAAVILEVFNHPVLQAKLVS